MLAFHYLGLTVEQSNDSTIKIIVRVVERDDGSVRTAVGQFYQLITKENVNCVKMHLSN